MTETVSIVENQTTTPIEEMMFSVVGDLTFQAAGRHAKAVDDLALGLIAKTGSIVTTVSFSGFDAVSASLNGDIDEGVVQTAGTVGAVVGSAVGRAVSAGSVTVAGGIT